MTMRGRGGGAKLVGTLLREARISAGLSQRDMAMVSGVSLGAIRDLEQGRTACPAWGTLESLAAVAHMDRSRLAELICPAQGRPAPVRVCVLGPLVASRDGVDIPLGAARQRTILGLLALGWRAGVGMGEIIDLLWGERPPPTAITIVHGCISRLRHLLEPAGHPSSPRSTVQMVADRYHLSADVHLDLLEFLALAGRARRAAEVGEVERACSLFERSLAMWRGDACAGLDLPSHHPGLADISRRRDEIVRQYTRVALAHGPPHGVLPHLQSLCDREPYDESAHAALMSALASAGRPAEALLVFHRLRRLLDSDLGIRPGTQVTSAYIQIIRHCP